MMKKLICTILTVAMAATGAVFAAPTRVALLDFEDETGSAPDAKLGGDIATVAIAG